MSLEGQPWELAGDCQFSDWASVIVERRNSRDVVERETERWWRVMVDVNDAPNELQYRHKRRMKQVECGIAAHVPIAEAAPRLLNPLRSRFFNCVPLKFESTLPVQMHATFLLSGDRQNIATEETSQDAGSDWNKWLLKKKIPQLYLQFLEDLGRKIGKAVYEYFPVESGEKQQSLSDLVQTAFWEEIKTSHHRSFPVVEPVPVEDTTKPERNLVRTTNRRTAPIMVEANRAVFDILDRQKSDAFRPLLSNCLDNLVCLPTKFTKSLRGVSHFKFVTPSLIRGVLRSEKPVQYVESMMEMSDSSFSVLLSFITPQSDSDFSELHGCRILPLQDGSLGTLSLISDEAQAQNSPTYYSASPECLRLFSFAPSYFSQDNLFVLKVLESERFNLRRFDKNHVHTILRSKKTWTADSESKQWLYDLWKYLNSTKNPKLPPNQPTSVDWKCLEHFPLLLLHQGSTETMKSLDYFRNNPAVLSSGAAGQQAIYADFAELEIVDSKTFPISDPEAGKSLSDVNAMNRFLQSLETLARRSGQSVTEFARSRLKRKCVEVSSPSPFDSIKSS